MREVDGGWSVLNYSGGLSNRGFLPLNQLRKLRRKGDWGRLVDDFRRCACHLPIHQDLFVELGRSIIHYEVVFVFDTFVVLQKQVVELRDCHSC